jgi:hypothetical protein
MSLEIVLVVNKICCSQGRFKNAPKFEYLENHQKNKEKQRMGQRALING